LTLHSHFGKFATNTPNLQYTPKRSQTFQSPMNIDPFPKPVSCKDKPNINYPCSWVYKVIGTDELALEKAITTVIGKKDLLITPSNTSSGGKYTSLNVEVVVSDDETRLKYYQHLKNHAAVTVVM